MHRIGGDVSRVDDLSFLGTFSPHFLGDRILAAVDRADGKAMDIIARRPGWHDSPKQPVGRPLTFARI